MVSLSMNDDVVSSLGCEIFVYSFCQGNSSPPVIQLLVELVGSFFWVIGKQFESEEGELDKKVNSYYLKRN